MNFNQGPSGGHHLGGASCPPTTFQGGSCSWPCKGHKPPHLNDVRGSLMKIYGVLVLILAGKPKVLRIFLWLAEVSLAHDEQGRDHLSVKSSAVSHDVPYGDCFSGRMYGGRKV